MVVIVVTKEMVIVIIVVVNIVGIITTEILLGFSDHITQNMSESWIESSLFFSLQSLSI